MMIFTGFPSLKAISIWSSGCQHLQYYLFTLLFLKLNWYISYIRNDHIHHRQFVPTCNIVYASELKGKLANELST